MTTVSENDSHESDDHHPLPSAGEIDRRAIRAQWAKRCRTRAIAHNDGRLELDVGNGARIRVASPSRGYEPWELAGPDGFLVVVNPGGELVMWRATGP